MGHAHKRLVSTIASASSTGKTPKFPPKKFLAAEAKDAPYPLNPGAWAGLQPSPPSALSAFANRIGLGSILSSTDVIQQVCTHPSFLLSHQAHSPEEPAPATNAQLQTIGNSLMGLFAAEYIHATYPYLPTRVLKAAVTAHVGPLTCASVAQEMGASPLLRWRRTVRIRITTCGPESYHCLASNRCSKCCASHRRPCFNT